MSTGSLLNLGLAFHLLGLSTSIGVVLTKFLFYKKTFSDRAFDHRKWTLILGSTRRLNLYLGIGMAVAILSGAFMMNLAYAAFMYQLWFRIKITVLLLIIIAGIITTRNESKLKKKLSEEQDQLHNLYKKQTRAIKLATGLQFLLFVMIIVLASFRFV
jgi:uncharacterized membrane protein